MFVRFRFNLPNLLFFLLFFHLSYSKHPRHVIRFRSPNLYPESLTYDPFSQHFLVSSLSSPSVLSVSDAAVVQPLYIFPSSSSSSSATLGLSLDSHLRRLLVVLQSPSSPSSLAALDLSSLQTVFLSPLPTPTTSIFSSSAATANAVAVDFRGNAFVTDSLNNLIYKVTEAGESSIFSNSSIFRSSLVIDESSPYASCGLNGIAYVSKGYLLVVQSNTGKLYKVDAEDGTARLVLLNRNLEYADGITLRRDGTAVVVSARKAWFVKSEDSWGEGVVYDEVELDEERFASDVAVGRDDRVYVMYGRVNEGIGLVGEKGVEREWFEIEEVRSRREEEGEDEGIWVYVVVGLGLVYFLVWRFQMRKLVDSMNKKTS